MRTKKKSNSILFTGIFKIIVLLSVFLFLFSISDKTRIIEKWSPVKNEDVKNKEKNIVDIKTDLNSESVKKTYDWSVEKVDEHITKISIPSDDRMSTVDELNQAMKSYRLANGLPELQKSDGICKIAQNRANEQLSNGGLDNHSGFNKYVQDQSEFNRMGEVLFGGNQPQYGVHIIEFGWHRSLTGHKEAIQDPSWQYGCGGIAGYYAVFIFGTK